MIKLKLALQKKALCCIYLNHVCAGAKDMRTALIRLFIIAKNPDLHAGDYSQIFN